MRVPFGSFILTACLVIFTSLSNAAQKDGYISDVQAERNERYYEVYLFVPHIQKQQTLQEYIFSPLTVEFKTKYKENFGEMDTDSIAFRAQSIGGITENPQIIEEQTAKRKKFAEYMTKRLIEHHVDQYMKTKPEMRPVLEAKEAIQNVKVEVTKEVRLNIQYNFAGNLADFIIDNPYCDSKVTLEMNPNAFGPSEILETRAWVSRPLTTTLRANTNLAVTDGIAYGDLTKSFPKYHLATTLGLSTPFKESGTSVRETKYIFAFSHAY
jgi:hypothetical protein